MKESQYSIAGQVELLETDGDALLIDTPSNCYYSINESGRYILDCIKREQPLSDVIQEISTNSKIDQDSIESSIKGYLKKLLELKLIERKFDS